MTNVGHQILLHLNIGVDILLERQFVNWCDLCVVFLPSWHTSCGAWMAYKIGLHCTAIVNSNDILSVSVRCQLLFQTFCNFSHPTILIFIHSTRCLCRGGGGGVIHDKKVILLVLDNIIDLLCVFYCVWLVGIEPISDIVLFLRGCISLDFPTFDVVSELSIILHLAACSWLYIVNDVPVRSI